MFSSCAASSDRSGKSEAFTNALASLQAAFINLVIFGGEVNAHVKRHIRLHRDVGSVRLPVAAIPDLQGLSHVEAAFVRLDVKPIPVGQCQAQCHGC